MLEATFKAPEILGAYQDQLKRAPRTVETFVQRTVAGYIRQRIASEVAPYPGPVVYAGPPGKNGQPTYRWKSPAQRRAFFAKMSALGLEPPYQRTGAYGKGWDVVLDLTNLVIGIVNNAQDPFGTYYAEFVGGPFQQPGHQDTGWIETQDPILNILIDALGILEEAWYDIISFEGLA